MVEIPSGKAIPKTIEKPCLCSDAVGFSCTHTRIFTTKAPAAIGLSDASPIVHGGKFDTAGYAKLPDLPIPKDIYRDANDAPLSRSQRQETYGKLKEHVRSKEYVEAKKERESLKLQNAAKRKRAEAIRRGENITLRSNKLPGDPSLKS